MPCTNKTENTVGICKTFKVDSAPTSKRCASVGSHAERKRETNGEGKYDSGILSEKFERSPSLSKQGQFHSDSGGLREMDEQRQPLECNQPRCRANESERHNGKRGERE